MIIRVEGLRKFFRVIGILLGFVMLVITVVMLATIVGFVIYYMVGGFGDGAAIFDCIKSYGLAFYTGVFVFAIIATVKQFSSFFGKY